MKMETVEDIINEMRDWDCHSHLDGAGHAELGIYADRLETAYHREVNRLLKIDNSCVAQCAVLLDDHIKALVANVKGGTNGNR